MFSFSLLEGYNQCSALVYWKVTDNVQFYRENVRLYRRLQAMFSFSLPEDYRQCLALVYWEIWTMFSYKHSRGKVNFFVDQSN